MITQELTNGEKGLDNKIKITRLKEINLVNIGLYKGNDRLAKAYSMKL